MVKHLSAETPGLLPEHFLGACCPRVTSKKCLFTQRATDVDIGFFFCAVLGLVMFCGITAIVFGELRW